jgi:fructosamine-3-kinase
VKTSDVTSLDNFQAESDGLHAMAEASVSIRRLRVLKPIAVGAASDRSWFLLPWIQRGSANAESAMTFGRCLAQLHRCTLGDDIGWPRNNYLGSTPQINTPLPDWIEFVAEHRIGSQIRRAIDAGLADAMLLKHCEQIMRTLDQILAGRDCQTSLIHGDLWSGNYFADQDGTIVLIEAVAKRSSVC